MNPFQQNSQFDPAYQSIVFVSKEDILHSRFEFISDFLFFEADKNEVQIMSLNHKKCFGVGIENETNLSELKKIAKRFSYQFRKKLNSEPTQIVFSEFLSESQIKALLTGLFEGTYEIKSEQNEFEHPLWNSDVEIFMVQKNAKFDLINAAREVQMICEGKFLSMDLLNLPPNFKNSEILAEFVQNFAKEENLSIKILNAKECEQQGLNAFLAVNQGSAFEPAFIILEYKPQNPQKTVGLVGKCITFDTGGISIKPSENMHYMKSDMGGACAVLGTLLAVSKLKSPHHIIAVLPATDNAVNNNSYLPGDVISSFSGKNIEVINTDAEGRMTLADGLSYMKKEFNPEILIDIATLTGSAVRALGYKAAAMLTVSDDLAEKMSQTGYKTGEKVWRFPLWDEYLEDITSDVADLKHISLTPVADVIYAGKFLEQFTDHHPNWIHLDIAGVAFGKQEYSKDKSASGYGVELLTRFILELK
ncbi:MAG: leucyl aminopeptidase family protein [Flavobacteriaceae bacterium]|nr:leucyl aminopeptidase family protein [Flavobacteriaceae bacterium]